MSRHWFVIESSSSRLYKNLCFTHCYNIVVVLIELLLFYHVFSQTYRNVDSRFVQTSAIEDFVLSEQQ